MVACLDEKRRLQGNAPFRELYLAEFTPKDMPLVRGKLWDFSDEGDVILPHVPTLTLSCLRQFQSFSIADFHFRRRSAVYFITSLSLSFRPSIFISAWLSLLSYSDVFLLFNILCAFMSCPLCKITELLNYYVNYRSNKLHLVHQIHIPLPWLFARVVCSHVFFAAIPVSRLSGVLSLLLHLGIMSLPLLRHAFSVMIVLTSVQVVTSVAFSTLRIHVINKYITNFNNEANFLLHLLRTTLDGCYYRTAVLTSVFCPHLKDLDFIIVLHHYSGL